LLRLREFICPNRLLNSLHNFPNSFELVCFG
jgi:hypothetical protein